MRITASPTRIMAGPPRLLLLAMLALSLAPSGQDQAAVASVHVRVNVPDGSPEGVVVTISGRERNTADFRAWAAVDAAGLVRFVGVPPGRVQLFANENGLIGRRRPVVVVGDSNEVHLRMRARDSPYGHVSGAVVDEQGAPVPQATIRLGPLAGPSGSRGRRSTTTGRDGTFAVGFLGEDNYRVEVSAPAHWGIVEEFQMRAGESIENVRWVVHSEVRVHGSLRGRDVPPESTKQWVIRATSLDVGPRSDRLERTAEVSGSRYSIGLPPGPWVLTAGWRRDGLGSRVVLGEVAITDTAEVELDLDLDVPDPVPFAIRIMVGGSAPEPVDVTLSPAFYENRGRRSQPGRWGPGDSTLVGPEGSARSDSEGWVRFDGVLPGEGRLTLRLGRALISRRVRVPEDDGLLVDAATTQLTGRVVDTEGNKVNRRNPNRSGGNVLQPGCWSHDLACDFRIIDGEFVTPPLQAGSTTLRVWTSGYSPSEVEVNVDPQLRAQEPVRIVLRRVHRLEANVSYPVEPISETVGFTICSDPECDEPVLDGWMGRRGNDLHRPYEKVPEGNWFLSAWTRFERIGPIPIVVPGPPIALEFTSTVGQVTALVPELYGHDLPLKLQLFRPDGTPVTIPAGDCSERSSWTGSHGRVVANCVPPGPYRIRVEAGDGRVWEENVEVHTYRRGETRLRARHLLHDRTPSVPPEAPSARGSRSEAVGSRPIGETVS